VIIYSRLLLSSIRKAMEALAGHAARRYSRGS
jgi:hypothetical protein